MKGIGIRGGTPIRIPNHRDPNQQLAISWADEPTKKNLRTLDQETPGLPHFATPKILNMERISKT